MKTLIALLLISSLVSPSLAVEKLKYAEFGVGFDSPNTGSYSDIKLVELGQQQHWKTFETSLGVGGWVDGSHYAGVQNSLYAQALFGVEPRSDNMYIHYLFGGAFVENTDTLLGSHLQFAHELAFGFKDVRDVRVGVAIKHFSNAGMTKVNYGRNFVVFQAAFK